MAEEKKELAKQKPEEATPDNPLVVMQADKARSAIERARQKVEVLKEVKQIALGYLTNGDVLDHNGNPYLEIDASMRIGNIFGVTFFDMRQDDIEERKDDQGPYLVVRTYGKAEFLGTVVEDVGVVSTRDEFFGKKGGTWKPLSEVDITDVEKKSATNLQNRLLKKLLGLKFSWEELEKAGISKEKCNKVRHGKGMSRKPVTEEEQKKQARLGHILMELAEQNQSEAKNLLKTMSSFPDKNKKGKMVKGVDSCTVLTGKRLIITLDKAEKAYKNRFGAEFGEVQQ
jgi:hypothetical protein